MYLNLLLLCVLLKAYTHVQIEMHACINIWTYIYTSTQTHTYPKILKQTLPFWYKLGLKRTVPPPVVSILTLGDWYG